MSSQGIMPFGAKDRGEGGELLIKVVSSVLDELIATPPSHGDEPPPVTKFHGLRAPSIAISDYLVRISKFSGCSDECFVLALIYIDRLITKRRVVLDQLNVHRLLVTSVMLAAKFFDDHYLDNQHYAAVGGVPKDYDMYRTALHAKFEGTIHPRHLLEDPYNEEATNRQASKRQAQEQPTAAGFIQNQYQNPQAQVSAGWRDIR